MEMNELDKQDIRNAVAYLDAFSKTFCRFSYDYNRFDDLKFRCEECPFQDKDEKCFIKLFKNQYAPDYIDFGSMGDL